MAYDYKKEYKELYKPKTKPHIIHVPAMTFLAVSGQGDPNTEGGDYQQAIELLYGIAYTLKMSYKTDYKINGFFEYVVPPLEGFWWQDDTQGVDLTRKKDFRFISLIRLPDFITYKDFLWAKETASKKKKKDFSRVDYITYDEGVCVQCMHLGPFNNEIETVNKMHEFINEQRYELDINDHRYHHEIYLSDPRKSNPEKLKTIIRHPIVKKQ